MKTSELKAILEEMGLAAYETKEGFRVAESNCTIATVNNRREHVMRIYMDAHAALGREAVAELFELMTAYASTPLDEREEPKKWRIKCPITDYYLNFNNDGIIKPIWSASAIETDSWKSKFTRAEIEAFTFPTEHLIEDEVSE
ncbi:hypothetical protein [Paenilisteria newyorkensis]|uniref:hypothetical protein n=1 Tax=Listeria newyorkensis TaxID=1497681 RepID=UPI000669E4F7|nr:hypothetical protein [Listeria newyorkensis]KMT62542.1 hypothetical protein X559_1080 [Listeria newyorkensis]